MSAFFIAINRNKRAFDPAVAEHMMQQLDRFGHDAKHLVVQDHFAIGYQSHWTVPEEQGERQPLEISDHQWFMFYGRLDNRQILQGKLDQPQKNSISDARLAQLYLQQHGTDRLTDLVGPFVLLSFDSQTDALLFARDGMGARSLSYKIDENHILVASYEMALAAHPSVEYKLNDVTVSCYMASQKQVGPSSMVSGLKILYPGYFLELNETGYELKRFYTPDAKHRIRFSNDDEYATEFRRLLTQAVARRMRCIGNIGTQLSGGMDSVPITIVAADHLSTRELATTQIPTADRSEEGSVLSAYSWVFDQYPDIDERKYSSPLCQKYKIEQVMVNCDELWLNYDDKSLLDPLGPIYNPFMSYNHELFKQARSRSVKVMLNGIYGDILYDYTQGILYELLKAREFKAAFAEARVLLQSSDSIKSFVKEFLFKPLTIVRQVLKWRAQKNSLRSEILQPHIVDQLNNRERVVNDLEKESSKALRPQQWQVVLGNFAGSDASIGRFLESEYAIERRYPFRDRELCEFMLAIPSEQLAFNTIKRPIVKRAFSDDFTDDLSKRNTKAYFADVTLNGLQNDQQNALWLESGAREWSYYVKECYFDGKVEQNHLLDVVKWRCGYYAYWKSVCYHPMVKKMGLINETSK